MAGVAHVSQAQLGSDLRMQRSVHPSIKRSVDAGVIRSYVLKQSRTVLFILALLVRVRRTTIQKTLPIFTDLVTLAAYLATATPSLETLFTALLEML